MELSMQQACELHQNWGSCSDHVAAVAGGFVIELLVLDEAFYAVIISEVPSEFVGGWMDAAKSLKSEDVLSVRCWDTLGEAMEVYLREVTQRSEEFAKKFY